LAKTTAEKSLPRFYWPVVLIFAVIAAGVFYLRPPILSALRNLAFDAYQRIPPSRSLAGAPIQVVHIDESSLARLGQWPWSRATMAELTQRLGDAGAAAIVFDVIFAEPDRTSPEQLLAAAPPARRVALARALGGAGESHDARFAASLHQFPTVLAASLHDHPSAEPFPLRAGFALAGDDPGPFLRNLPGVATSLPALSDAADGVGFINWLPDGDQIVRRVPLLLGHNDEIAPSLALEALRVAFGASTYVVRSANASGTSAFGAHTGINAVKVGPLTIPTDAEGQIWLRFRAYDHREAMPAWRILDPSFEPGRFEGAIVLVGASAPGLMDLRATPLDASIPGVQLHRQLLEQILGGDFLQRPDFAPGSELLIALLAIAVLAIAAPRFGPSINAAIGFSLVAAIWSLGLLLFVQLNYLFDPIFPTLAALVFAAGSTTYFYQRTEHQRADIRRAFGQYVAPSVIRQLTAHPERLKLGGEVRELSILVCDIRGFSKIAERMSAEQLTAFINSFLTPLSDIVIENGGTIDKYMGDAILAFWNAPLDQADHAERACRAAMQIMACLEDLNIAWRSAAEAAGRPFEQVRIGIGVNTGECCVGNLGSERRFDYSAIGDNVNIASRLESLTKAYGLVLLISEQTRNGATDMSLIEADLVRLHGREGATRVFTATLEQVIETSQHTAFLEAFRQGRFDEARMLLTALQATSPAGLAGLYANYEGRLKDAAQMARPDWSGVYDPERK
jgi:adenylate cyclase